MAPRGLDERLARWEQAGLITSAQRGDIADYERAHGRQLGSQLVLYGFLVLGGAVVSIGLVSLVAANWDVIPAAAKLVTALLVLLALAAGIWRAEDRGQAITFDVLAVVYVLATLAGLGLVGQVFHTGGQLHHALLFWAALTFLLATRGKRMFLPSLWVVSLVAAVWAWLVADDGLWGMLWHHGDDNALALAAFAALGLAGLAALTARVPLLVRFAANFRVWSLVAFAIDALCADLTWTGGETIERTGAAPAAALLVPALACVLSEPGRSRSERATLAVLCVLAVLPFVHGLFGLGDLDDSPALGAACFVVVTAALAVHLAASGHPRWFHAMTLLVGGRFLVVYLQLFSDLATTGIGLVLSGVVIIGLALGWYRSRAHLEAWTRGLLA